MPRLVLGPLLRYAGEREATVWVEADEACQVEVLGCREPTFSVAGHHYALVHVDGLEPGRSYEYEVALDGERVWPEPGWSFPPSVIRTTTAEGPFEIAFGSCRVAAPHVPPYTLGKDEHPEGREVDALVALVERLRGVPPQERPRLLVLLGDQVYADEASPEVRAFIRSRRDPSEPPGEQVADFEEYTRLYLETWRDPPMRWLLSTIPTVMVFDDHDMHDDWNTSAAWVETMRAEPWWEEHIAGGFMSYWIYQHVGNLAPADLHTDAMYDSIRRSGGDVTAPLREFALEADRGTGGSQWSYCRDVGAARLVMIDSRAGRVLGEGGRAMLDEREWDWIERQASKEAEHLLLGTSLPFLLAPGMHHLEAWNEAVCSGAWGRRAAGWGERVRQGLDLEHWAAFGASFEQMCSLVADIGAGRRGPAPASIVFLSGDVHHAYVADVAFPRSAGVRSAVAQAVCSPFRNPLMARERAAVRAAAAPAGHVLGRLLSRAAGVPDPPIRWRLTQPPIFDNQVGTLRIDGRSLEVRIERALPDEHDQPRLETTLQQRLV